jgi:mannose-6-phosphate isomerase class I
MKHSNYDKFPHVEVPDGAGCCDVGWNDIARRLREAIGRRGRGPVTMIVECYAGVCVDDIRRELAKRLDPALVLDACEAMLPPGKIDSLVAPFLGGDDPVFGYLSNLTLPEWFDAERVESLRTRIAAVESGVILVVGCGAWHICPGDILVYADLTRWESQNRFRHHESGNLGAENRTIDAGLLYKRAFFVDWRVCDRWKRPLIDRWDFVLDTNDGRQPKMAEAAAVRRGLHHAATRPFRVVPFFDPAPWGGQWMKEVCDLDRRAANFGWCFDCVPEENSLLLNFSIVNFELPSIDLVFQDPTALLGEAVQARFGDEFPIRFDFLDTMGGGNLSFQVHPLSEYIERVFGLNYTQDESYYLLDAGDDACVYLGLKENVDPASMLDALEAAQNGGPAFDAERYANRWPAKKHDHFLIPAGTVHCSGRNSMVLEISATPYIFTFKLWDWARLGLDGRPRPIHLPHGAANIQWDRTTAWVRENLIDRCVPIAEGDGWREERTGLHESEFIETRRHWFAKTVPHDTHGGVNVLNLVEGAAAVVESPVHAFKPFEVHYAETFIVPAAVGPFSVRPLKPNDNLPHATIKAFVRS